MKKILSILIALVLLLSATAALADHPVTGASGLTKQLAVTTGASQSRGFPAHSAAQIGAPATAAHIAGMYPQSGPVINNARVLNDSVITRYLLQLCAMAGYNDDTGPVVLWGNLFLKYGNDMPDGMKYSAQLSWDICYDGVPVSGNTFHSISVSNSFIQSDVDDVLLEMLAAAELHNANPVDEPDNDLVVSTTAGMNAVITLENGAVYTFNYTLKNPIPEVGSVSFFVPKGPQ